MKINEYVFLDIMVGMKASFQKEITQGMLNGFLKLTDDCNPLHNDTEYAQSLGYADKVCYGMLTASLVSTLAGVYLPGKYSLIHSVDLSFPRPVILGDILKVSGQVVDKNEAFKYFILKVEIRNQRNEKVCRGKMQIGVSK